MRGRGGYIGFNRVPAAAAFNSAASGVWTLQEAESLKRAGTWPISFVNPASITGLQLWLDAADSATLFDATSGGSLVAADGGVARWEDKSGNAQHATQGTSANRPARKLSVSNNKDGLLFDGTNDSLSLAADLAIGPSQTVFIVAKPSETITAVSASRCILSGGNFVLPSTTTSSFAVMAGAFTGTLTDERLAVFAVANSGEVTGVYAHAKTNADIPASVFDASYRFNSTGNIFSGRLNRIDDFATIASSSNNPFSTTNSQYPTVIKDVGTRIVSGTPRDFWNGHILEIVVYNSAISDTNRGFVETYLTTKWGIT